jgi:hypothetical protein
VAVDGSGNLYIADFGLNRIRKVTPGGVISTIAGTGAAGSTWTGTATTTQINRPYGIAVVANGDVYFADSGNNRVLRVSGATISVVAGSGTAGAAGDHGAATSALLNAPRDVVVDTGGNLYIASSGELRIRQLSLQTSAAWFWVSDADLGATRVVYGWEFVSRSATAIKSITLTVPVSATTSVYLVDAVNLPTTGTVSLSGGVVTYTLAATVTVPAGRHMHLSIGGFTNTGSAGVQHSTITTLTSGGAAVDVSTSGAVYFSLATPVLPVPRPAATVTSPVITKIYVDPLLQPDTTVVTTLAVQVNATNGYALTVSGTALTGVNGTLAPVSANLAGAVTSGSFGVNRIGYTATVTGLGSCNATAGSYAGYTTGGETAVTATRPTAVTGDTVQITNRIRIDYLQTAGTYSGTLSYRVTGDY